MNCEPLLEPYRPAEPLEGPLLIGVKAFLSIPKSWTKKKKGDALNGRIVPIVTPDLSNLIKHIEDCMSPLRKGRTVLRSGFWTDDSLVYKYLPSTGKHYDDGQGPRWEIELMTFEDYTSAFLASNEGEKLEKTPAAHEPGTIFNGPWMHEAVRSI